MAATTAATTREVEAVTKAVDSGSLGRFFSVSVSAITGASKLTFMPTTSIISPLSTTFVHILRLNRLLSIRKFQVETLVRDSRYKTRNVAVNQEDDH